MYGKAFVCIFGMGVVFVGLICIIFLSYLMGVICQKLVKKPAGATAASVAAPAVEPNRQAVIAAVSAVLAEEMDTDVKGLRILSFKKL